MYNYTTVEGCGQDKNVAKDGEGGDWRVRADIKNTKATPEERQQIISNAAEEVLKLLLAKKMSYADTCEVLHIAQIQIEEFTYPVYQNF